MATPAATAAEYCTLLVKSKLLPAAEVEALYRKWKEERPGDDARVDSFRRFLVERRALTDYQARLVQRGRAEGFFLGGYKILDQVGRGHMGGVYKAVHGAGQVVALKILPASKAKDAHTLARFQREARLLTQLDHPNVVRAFQVGESGGVHYIVMEYLEGETLDEVIARRGRLPAAEAARLACQVFDGLQHLHEKRMIHRDVKPANLMLTPAAEAGKPDTWNATVKVLDVGLGRELFDEAAPGQAETQLTQEGSVVGTPDYLAPEQAKDARAADIRADVYSAGCVLYQCLAGRPPFTESNIMAQMVKHATEPPPPLSTFAEGVPPGLQHVVDRLLAKKPGDRYQTPAEAVAALQPFATAGAAADGENVVPAFQDWLASESQLEATRTVPGTGPRPAFGASSPAKPAGKPGTGPAPAVKSGTVPPPATKPAPARPAPAAQPIPSPFPAPVPAPAAAPFPMPVPAPVVEVDVELVTVPAPMPTPGASFAEPEERPLWPPDRRDWLMLAGGAGAVLSAVGFGYGLARLLRRKDSDE